MEEKNKKVQFTRENLQKCICAECPVQISSVCVKEMLDNDVAAKPQEFPKLYCSSGVANCKDIQTQRVCICGNCAVWRENKLGGASPALYFCRDGKAK